jgi:hypothetical protein
MPNSANKNGGSKNSGSKSSGQGQHHHPEEQQAKNTQKPNPERSDVKAGTDHNDGHTSRSSNQGRKSASGGTVED